MEEAGFEVNMLQLCLKFKMNTCLDSIGIDKLKAKKAERLNEYVCLKLYIDYCSWLIFKVLLFVSVVFNILSFVTVNNCTRTHTYTKLHAVSVADQIVDRPFNYTPGIHFLFFFYVFVFDTNYFSLGCYFSLSLFSVLLLCIHNINGQNYPSIGTIEWKHRTYFFSRVFQNNYTELQDADKRTKKLRKFWNALCRL